MMFRKLYWITEQIDAQGAARATGIYTSIPDLIRRGLPWQQRADALRLTLCKLDSDKGPLGSWSSPDFEGLSADLQEFIASDEFGEDQCRDLLRELTAKQAQSA